MGKQVDFWEMKWPWNQGDIEIDVSGTVHTIPFDGTSAYPTEKFNQLNNDIANSMQGGVFPSFGVGPGARADRFLSFFASEPFEVTMGSEFQAYQLGYESHTFESVGMVGDVFYTQPSFSFQGAFAVPENRFIHCKADPMYIQSQSQPLSGPPVVVTRGEYKEISVLYKYVPGPMIYLDRLEREHLREYGPGMGSGEAFGEVVGNRQYSMEVLWEELRKGREGFDVRLASTVSSRVNRSDIPVSMSELGSSTPFPSDYTEDNVYEGVYFREEEYIRSMDALVESTQESTGKDSYHVEFKVCSDA